MHGQQSTVLLTGAPLHPSTPGMVSEHPHPTTHPRDARTALQCPQHQKHIQSPINASAGSGAPPGLEPNGCRCPGPAAGPQMIDQELYLP